ncbi:MAG: hypothetical protein KA004_15755 [Verrucomicrobiales bacterium]|nr:hypothetical protein [Verrucomicrobiales bacterium]
MQNPYHHEFPPERLVIRRSGAWTVALLFLAMLALPPLWEDWREMNADGGWLPAREFARTLTDGSGPQPLAGRLKAFETRLGEESDFAIPARQMAQEQFLRWLGRGNNRTLPVRDGWFFYRPELRALTGHGPLQPEPGSVAKDPTLADWKPPLPAIQQFARDLKDRGVALWMLPLPMKESIYPEKLTGHPAPDPVQHPDTAALFQQLEAAGIRVLDAAPLLWLLKATDDRDGPVYLKQDTHWTPRAMEATAAWLATKLKEAGITSTERRFRAEPPRRAESRGDLVEKLDLGPRSRVLSLESTSLRCIRQADGGPVMSDRSSPVVLLGDSFVNIYDDPALGFADAAPGETRLGAGFAQHLAWQLQRSVDVIASNGGGASTVREQFANRPDDEVRAKQIVVWMPAARDLFLPRTEARSTGVEWRAVTFNPKRQQTPSPTSSHGSVIVEATVLEKSAAPNPKTVDYPEALYTVRYRIDRVLQGEFKEPEAVVMHWLFQDRKFVPTAEVEIGSRYRLTLSPWLDQAALQSKKQIDDVGGLDVFFAPSADPPTP